MSSSKYQSGLTLIELIVTLVIVGILASAALPFAEISVRRDHELELRQALREIRTAIDAFHTDWEAGRIPLSSDAASENGYPKTLTLLVDGVSQGDVADKKRYYLRRIPRNPLADQQLPTIEQWHLRSYLDTPDNTFWGGEDVYDVRVNTDKKAIDGSEYKNW